MNSYRLGETLTKLRTEKHLTQEELAGMIGVSRQAISRWERGEGNPDLSNLKALANVFDVEVDVLLGGNARNNLEPEQSLVSGTNYMKGLLFKAKRITNGEDARRLRRKLFKLSAIFAGSGIVVLIVGIILLFTPFNSDSILLYMVFHSPFTIFLFLVVIMILMSLALYMLIGALGIKMYGVATDYLDTREKCPQCGDEIDADEKVCSNCGYHFEKKELICSTCGKINKPGDKFCRECGSKLE